MLLGIFLVQQANDPFDEGHTHSVVGWLVLMSERTWYQASIQWRMNGPRN